METTLRAQTKATPPPSTSARGGLLQRKCACGGTPGPTGECEACRQKRLQRFTSQPSTFNSQPAEVPPIVHEVLRSPGQPLDSRTRAFMEPRFGHDFTRIRIHNDEKASESARALDAQAFTLGNHVVFATRQYSPATTEGQTLLAHELTHAIQQSGVASQSASQLKISSPSDPLEQEAERISQTVVGNLRDVPTAGNSFFLPKSGVTANESNGFLAFHQIDQVPGIVVPPLGVTPARSFGAPRLARAVYNVGALTIQIDYGNIIRVPTSDYETEIEGRFASWTGSPAAIIHAALAALTQDQKRWVLFGLDILVDNTAAAHSGFNRVQGVQRLIAHAPSAAAQPLSGPLPNFPNEVLRVSGWFEIALSARLTAPTGATLTSISTLVNPPPGPSAPPGGALDAVRLNADIPPALIALLQARDPASWPSVGTDPIGGIQSIGDQIQVEARAFFAPYGDTAVANAYSRGWVYSAHITSTVPMVPTVDDRISYLLNRAEIVGRKSQLGGAIFDNCNYDSSRPADQAALLAIVTPMEADPVIQPLVNRLIQHTGQTAHPPGGPEVGISTEFNLSTTTECAARWQTIKTLTHELVHAMVHPTFPVSASSIRFGQIVVEGFTEVLGVQLYETIRSRAGSNAAFKGQMEAGIAAAPCPVPPAATIGYGQAGANAESIRALVGNDNFRAAYFLGAVKLVGL
ncbi:MAG TPA: DUF4157 domain-containing protein [Candidatus Udaeobacter sp.]|nr:DUF4157 domain-containing protein [Candidatus Udaeobacter sp.]